MPKIDESRVTSFIQRLAVGSSNPDAVRDDVDAYLSRSYVQNRHGVKSNYEETILHLAKVRSSIAELKVELIDLVVDEKNSKFASRHVAYVKNMEGKESSVEVGLFGNFDEEGKFTYVYEMARQL